MRCSWNLSITNCIAIVQLGPNLSVGFGPKVNTKLTVKNNKLNKTNKKTKTFRGVIGIVEGKFQGIRVKGKGLRGKGKGIRDRG